MSEKYIQKTPKGEWKVTATKTGKALRIFESQKEAMGYASDIRATTAIFVKQGREWVKALELAEPTTQTKVTPVTQTTKVSSKPKPKPQAKPKAAVTKPATKPKTKSHKNTSSNPAIGFKTSKNHNQASSIKTRDASKSSNWC